MQISNSSLRRNLAFGAGMLLLAAGANACGHDSKKSSATPAADGGAAGAATDTTAATDGSGGASSTTSAGGEGASGGTTDGAASTSQGSGGIAGTMDSTGSTGSAGAGATGSSGAPGLSIDDFCDLLQARARSWLRECRSFGDAAGWWGTQRIDRLCDSGRAAVSAGRLRYDPAQAQACAALSVGGCNNIEAFAYSESSTPQAGWLQSNACDGVLSPKVALGGVCHPDSTDYTHECLEGFCSQDACPGTCVPYVGLDEACDATSRACDPASTFCSEEAKCEPYALPGDNCDNARCRPIDTCAYNEELGAAVCTELVAPNAACNPASQRCSQGQVCYQGLCTDELPLGADCTSTENCPQGSYCDGTCLPRVDVDGDCSAGQLCVAEAVCDDGSCVLWGEEDDPCPCATGYYCDDSSLCQVLGAAGANCARTDDSPGLERCQAGLRCLPSTIGAGLPEGYLCAQPSTLGGYCLPQAANTCKAPYFCNPQTFTCEEPGLLEETCNWSLPQDSCADGYYCTCTDQCDGQAFAAIGQCQPQVGAGETCSVAAACKSGLCSSNTCQNSLACP